MKALIELLMKMGKTKEEALEIIGKDLPTGGIDDVTSNIMKPITRKVVGDYPLVGSRITDPTSVKNFDLKSVSESIADQEKNWKKTFEFLSEGNYTLSALQKQNLTYNLGILKKSKDTAKNLSSERFDALGKYLEKRDTLFSPEKADVFDLTGKKIKPDETIIGGKGYKIETEAEIKSKLDELLGPGDDVFGSPIKDWHMEKFKKPPKAKDVTPDLSKYDDASLNALVDEDIKLLAEANKLSEAGENYGRVKAIKARREEIAKILKAAQDVPESGYDNFRADLAAKKQTESQIKTKLEKPGQGKFTKAEYLIQRLKNTIKEQPDDKYVQETFPNFIKELEANPDLAKNENVFKELGGDLPKDQQIVVYDDDTLDFFRQTEGPGNIDTLAKFMEDNPFLSREEGLNLLKMEPTDRVLELTKLRHLNKKKTDNAEGGIIGYALGGQII